MLKAIIFDLDGVLINTPQYVWETHNKLLSKFGKRVSHTELPKYLGLGTSLNNQIDLLEKNFDINIDREKYQKQFEIEIKQYLHDIKKNYYLLNLIEKLSQKFKLAVATSSPKTRTEYILKKLGIKNYFKVIVTPGSVKKDKPNPGIFIEAAKRLEVEPKACLVIEDAAVNIKAAKRVNMTVCALKTKFQTEEDLKDADLIINDLSEIDTKKLKK